MRECHILGLFIVCQFHDLYNVEFYMTVNAELERTWKGSGLF
jgi:hypothetical protein